MRVLLTLIVYLIAFAAVATIAFFGVLILAGPHSDLLPSAAQPVVLVAGWLSVLIGPALVARFAWRRTAGRFGHRGRAGGSGGRR